MATGLPQEPFFNSTVGDTDVCKGQAASIKGSPEAGGTEGGPAPAQVCLEGVVLEQKGQDLQFAESWELSLIA